MKNEIEKGSIVLIGSLGIPFSLMNSFYFSNWPTMILGYMLVAVGAILVIKYGYLERKASYWVFVGCVQHILGVAVLMGFMALALDILNFVLILLFAIFIVLWLFSKRNSAESRELEQQTKINLSN